jgi:hypothetical protein
VLAALTDNNREGAAMAQVPFPAMQVKGNARLARANAADVCFIMTKTAAATGFPFLPAS